ncbi:pentapeptide repeat-containing protein [Nonomuraea sp. ZG12]|uniref:pentapeptide repeat-containing protein n=1 Tax=Nonomuraea sp. ZG12 TaxID=3452207 RepID=UPI003F8A63DE
MEAIRTGLSVGAGTGGAVALLLAMRRQWLSERDQAHREEVNRQTQAHAERVATATEHDAAERRVTDLYIKAVDQLGNENAPVRLGGLYALERLAQGNPAHQQSVVNVICSYLRMPFNAQQPPAPADQDLKRLSTSDRAAKAAEHAAEVARWKQERLVRLTAQSMLATHIFTIETTTEWPRQTMPPDPAYWPGISLNLSDATLIDFCFQGRVNDADFTGALFVGVANFAHASFDGHAVFRNARFEGGAGHFYGTWFGLRAIFINTDFGKAEAVFEGATFAGMLFLRDAKFGGGVTLRGARALADFNTGWGDTRRWPEGWRERPLANDEVIPRPRWGAWAKAPDLPPGDPTWRLVVADKIGPDEQADAQPESP